MPAHPNPPNLRCPESHRSLLIVRIVLKEGSAFHGIKQKARRKNGATDVVNCRWPIISRSMRSIVAVVIDGNELARLHSSLELLLELGNRGLLHATVER